MKIITPTADRRPGRRQLPRRAFRTGSQEDNSPLQLIAALAAFGCPGERPAPAAVKIITSTADRRPGRRQLPRRAFRTGSPEDHHPDS